MDGTDNRKLSHVNAVILLLGLLLTIAAAIVGAIAGFSAAKATESPPPLMIRTSGAQAGFADLVAKIRPAVVNISTTQAFRPNQSAQLDPNGPFGEMLRQFFGPNANQLFQSQQTPSHALGSGFVIDPAGYVVTNNHVINDADGIKITFADGMSYSARVVGRDTKTDLALLKISADKPLPYVAFGDSDNERVGDWVVAVGNPYGLGGSVTAGVISAKDRDINAGAYDDFFQIDAPINPGNSGGPLFNQSGRVVGIDTAIFSPSGGSVGVGFAIPSNEARGVIDHLREHGRVARGWLGVQMQAMTQDLAKAMGITKAEGVVVDLVTPGSPAERAGLKQEDVITSFDGQRITTPRALALAVANVAAGQSAFVTVHRNGEDKTFTVQIGTEPAQSALMASASPQTGRLGLELAPLSAYGGNQIGQRGGAVVASVSPGSPAERSGIQPNDVVLAVGSRRVTSLDDTVSSIRSAEADNKNAVLLLVRRGQEITYVPIEIGKG